jgi:hypothetical protein
MNKRELTKDIILYLMQKLGDRVEGKKKIMKLMFLLEHYDFDLKKIVDSQKIGNEFFIYYYGVFSTNVMQSISSLTSEGKIKDGLPLKLKSRVSIKLDPEIQSRVDEVITKFGDYSGYKLEIGTLKMLGITPFDKDKYMGESVKDILAKQK